MNILVIATHHGAFLTLAQLKIRGREHNVTVVIPQSQIDKYKKFEGDVFTKYEQNMKKFCGKKFELFVSEDWDTSKKPTSSYAFLNTLGKTGKWLVMEAGSLLGGNDGPLPECTTFGVVKARVYPNKQKLYEMLGQPAVSDTISLSSFIVNMDDKSMRYTFLDSSCFHRPDILYPNSFGTLACLRAQKKCKGAFTLNFWMEVIRKKQEVGEWVAYPYDQYLQFAEKCISYLPVPSAMNIVSNGLETEWLYELIELDL